MNQTNLAVDPEAAVLLADPPGPDDHLRGGPAGDEGAHGLLRLPHGVKELFTDWLRRFYPDRERRVLARLAPRQRAVVYLTLVEGRTAREAATILGILPATARVHRHRALAHLRRALEEWRP